MGSCPWGLSKYHVFNDNLAQFDNKFINNLSYNYLDYINVYLDAPLRNIQSLSPFNTSIVMHIRHTH